MTKCKSDGCSKIASFNIDGLPPKFCKNHKTEIMKNTMNKCCLECGKRASFNYPNEKMVYIVVFMLKFQWLI